jgi:hypothetical protein
VGEKESSVVGRRSSDGLADTESFSTASPLTTDD